MLPVAVAIKRTIFSRTFLAIMCHSQIAITGIFAIGSSIEVFMKLLAINSLPKMNLKTKIIIYIKSILIVLDVIQHRVMIMIIMTVVAVTAVQTMNIIITAVLVVAVRRKKNLRKYY